jgi:hypothetical protein
LIGSSNRERLRERRLGVVGVRVVDVHVVGQEALERFLGGDADVRARQSLAIGLAPDLGANAEYESALSMKFPPRQTGNTSRSLRPNRTIARTYQSTAHRRSRAVANGVSKNVLKYRL